MRRPLIVDGAELLLTFAEVTGSHAQPIPINHLVLDANIQCGVMQCHLGLIVQGLIDHHRPYQQTKRPKRAWHQLREHVLYPLRIIVFRHHRGRVSTMDVARHATLQAQRDLSTGRRDQLSPQRLTTCKVNVQVVARDWIFPFRF